MKLASLCFAAFLLAGCAKNIDTPEAVKAGIIKDIAKKVDVGSMDVNIDSVSFREKEADARVSFSPRGAGASQAITMTYLLERQGDEWHVKSRSMDSHEHAQPGQIAPQPGPIAPQAGQTALPPGHPPVNPSRTP